MEDTYTAFRKFNFWRYHELVGSGQKFVWSDRVTENGPVDISGFNAYAHVNSGYFEHKFWTCDFLVYFVYLFIRTDFVNLIDNLYSPETEKPVANREKKLN